MYFYKVKNFLLKEFKDLDPKDLVSYSCKFSHKTTWEDKWNIIFRFFNTTPLRRRPVEPTPGTKTGNTCLPTEERRVNEGPPVMLVGEHQTVTLNSWPSRKGHEERDSPSSRHLDWI